jgi:GT2 family glycosyltransferase
VPPLVSVCIANYNGESVLPATLAAIAGDLGADAEVIIADDASTDASIAVAERAFPGVRILRQSPRRGPAAARNAAMRAASYERALFLDNDMQVMPGGVAVLAEALDADAAAVAAMPCVLHAAQASVVQYDGAGAHVLGLMTLDNEERLASEIDPATREIGSIVSSCLLVDRRRLAALIGDGAAAEPFDPEFGIYLEDHDFALCARIAGGKLLAVPRARALHGAGTEGLSLRRRGRYSRERVRALIRNRWRVVTKTYSSGTVLALAPSLALFEATQFAGAIAKGCLASYVAAAGDFIAALPDLLARRRRIQSTRRISDAELLSSEGSPFAFAAKRGGVERAVLGAILRITAFQWKIVRGLMGTKIA